MPRRGRWRQVSTCARSRAGSAARPAPRHARRRPRRRTGRTPRCAARARSGNPAPSASPPAPPAGCRWAPGRRWLSSWRRLAPPRALPVQVGIERRVVVHLELAVDLEVGAPGARLEQQAVQAADIRSAALRRARRSSLQAQACMWSAPASWRWPVRACGGSSAPGSTGGRSWRPRFRSTGAHRAGGVTRPRSPSRRSSIASTASLRFWL
jgi:hypothetical protein